MVNKLKLLVMKKLKEKQGNSYDLCVFGNSVQNNPKVQVIYNHFPPPEGGYLTISLGIAPKKPIYSIKRYIEELQEFMEKLIPEEIPLKDKRTPKRDTNFLQTGELYFSGQQRGRCEVQYDRLWITFFPNKKIGKALAKKRFSNSTKERIALEDFQHYCPLISKASNYLFLRKGDNQR